jgi:hypothetical protein
MSYFDSFVFGVYNKFSHFKILNGLGGRIDLDDLLSMELEAFAIIEQEASKADRVAIDRKAAREKVKGNKHGRK